MHDIKVLFHGSCWPTNIGNAFVNLGTIHSLKSAIGENGRVFHVGGMSGYLFTQEGKLSNSLPYSELINCDYLVNAGMTMCKNHLISNLPIYQKFTDLGVKIIFAGAGAGDYSDLEVKMVRKAMKKFPIYGLISRDDFTFETYSEFVQHSYNGIDSALFIGDYYKPISLNISEFDIRAFDSLKEPQINHEGRTVIRTHHTCWPKWLKSSFFKYSNTLISDLPSDYLNLYSQANVVYSDRVHACIPALAYGRQAMIFYKPGDKRFHMFQRLNIPEINKNPVRLDREWLIKEKQNQIQFLKSIIL